MLIRLISTEYTYFLQAISASFPSTWQGRIALMLFAHPAVVPAHPNAAEEPAAEATATFLSCQPGACWLVAKPAALAAQGKPQPRPEGKQGFRLQRQATSAFSLNSYGANILQDTAALLAAARSSHRNWFPVDRLKVQALTWELSEGRFPGSPSLTACGKCNFKLKKRKTKRRNIKAFHKLMLCWQGGNYAILNSEAICKGKDQEIWIGCPSGRGLFCSIQRNGLQA